MRRILTARAARLALVGLVGLIGSVGLVGLGSLGAPQPAGAQSRPNRAAAAQPAGQPALTQPPAPQAAAPEEPDPQDGDDRGGAGYLPGAQFQRKLDGGPGFVCTATNARHTDQCTASCRAGETADCIDADGGGTPSCACTKG